MTTVLYIVVAILIFGLLIMIHEFGHFIVARRCGVRVEEFSIGMGPKLYQRTTKKTGMLFSVRALPIGGYVSMMGEEEDEDSPDSFSRKPVWQRMAIIVAGATMNLLLGFLIVLIIVFYAKGMYSTTIKDFAKGATSNAEGGLVEGDTILKIGNVPVHTAEEVVYEIGNQATKPVRVTIRRNGEKLVLENVSFPTYQESGVIFGDRDFNFLVVEHPGFGDYIRAAFFRSCSMVKMVWDSLWNLITGKYSADALSGPIGVTAAVKNTIAESHWDPSGVFVYVMTITALITINLGVFNLIPFPALDGGRFFFLLIEAITRKRIPQSIESKINFAGMAALMLLMLFVACKDVINLF